MNWHCHQEEEVEIEDGHWIRPTNNKSGCVLECHPCVHGFFLVAPCQRGQCREIQLFLTKASLLFQMGLCHQNWAFNPKYKIFLTTTKWFLCLNITTH